jgi:hypothetical protein
VSCVCSVALVMTLLGVFQACRPDASASPDASDACQSMPRVIGQADPPLPEAAREPFALQLNVPSEVQSRQPVPLRITLQNTGSGPVKFGLGDAENTFDIVVRRPDGTEVWRRLRGRVIVLVSHWRLLASGDRLSFEDTWNQRDNQGHPVQAGIYCVQGTLLTSGSGAWGTRPQPVAISPPRL